MTTLDLLPGLRAAAPSLHTAEPTAADTVDGHRPTAVVAPSSYDEVAAVLRHAAEHGLTIGPRGGGTMLDLGNPPARLDLLLDLSRLNAIVEHRPHDLIVTVQAGVTIAALQAQLAQHGQMLALNPPLPERATAGGVLAADAWGPRRQRWGTARDLLIGSRAVYADGALARAGGNVVKNVAGYDLNKLLIGSLGTVAVIVEATFKLTPLPPAFAAFVAAFPGLDTAHAAALRANNGPHRHLSLDLVSPASAPSLLDSPPDGWLLVVEAGGEAPAVERTTRDLAALAREHGATSVSVLEGPEHERLTIRLRDHGRTPDSAAPVILRASVLPSDTPRAVNLLDLALPAAAFVVRAGSGVVYAYAETLPDAHVISGLRDALGHMGGSLVIERCPAEHKAALDVFGLSGPDVALMRRIKETYDPAGTLAPGRLLPAAARSAP